MGRTSQGVEIASQNWRNTIIMLLPLETTILTVFIRNFLIIDSQMATYPFAVAYSLCLMTRMYEVLPA